MKHYSNSIVKRVLNTDTGELEPIRFTQDIQYNQGKKRGWVPMYKNGYDEVMINLGSKLEHKLFIEIRDMFTSRNTEVAISQVDLANRFDSTPPTINRLIKKLLEIEFLLKIRRGVYRMNPFILIPYQADGYKLQEEWDELMNL